MFIERLSLCGFRGVKEKLELTVPSGFMVVSGRNGSGKSTLCDAIEFALTGRFRTAEHKEKGESITDYIWWRGPGEPADRSVSLVLRSPGGQEFTVTRTPDGIRCEGAKNVGEFVCNSFLAAPDAVARLCRTSILRDEEITRLSVDMPETERFAFVHSALGVTDFAGPEERAVELQKLLRERYERLRRQYDNEWRRVSDITARLSNARTEARTTGDVKAAEETMKSLLDVPSVSPRELLDLASNTLAERRVQVDNLIRLLDQLRSLERRRQQVTGEDHKRRVAQLSGEVAVVQKQLSKLEQEISSVEREIARQRGREPRLASLAQLCEHGKRLGLDEERRCPLCGSAVSPADFAAHLSAIEEQVRAASDASMRSAQNHADLSEQRLGLRQKLDQAKRDLAEEQEAEVRLEHELAEMASKATELGLVSPEGRFDATVLSSQIESLRKNILTVERSVAVLEASRAYERVTRLEAELQSARTAAEAAERAMGRAASAVQRVKDALDTIRRLRGEAIDESLAELAPLMAELYARLRPHVEWQEISYHLRGDVRRFLSFEVGDGLNPSFLFSSGQRRAAGMAFLLAVYLSRPWCRLKSLVLDDPVQHVDDFRALNLTEVLVAIRRAGRQIICTTEDRALAELMCRRLRSSEGNEGVLVQVAYDAARGVRVKSVRAIRPLASCVLVPA